MSVVISDADLINSDLTLFNTVTDNLFSLELDRNLQHKQLFERKFFEAFEI